MSMEYNHDKENFKKWCSKNNIAMDANKLEKLFLEAFPNSKGGLYSVNNSPEAKNNIVSAHGDYKSPKALILLH